MPQPSTLPSVNTPFQIQSLKADGSHNRTWETNRALFIGDDLLIGTNNRTYTRDKNGIRQQNQKGALFFFYPHQWFNIVYILDGLKSFYYCNLCSPFTFTNHTLTYIDYDIDVVVDSAYKITILDQDEFLKNKAYYHYSLTLEETIKNNLATLLKMIHAQANPFNAPYIKALLTRYQLSPVG